MRAYAAANGGQRGRLFDNRSRAENVACLKGFDEARDIDVHRTALYAGRVLTVQATMRLRDGLLERQTLVNFLVQRFDTHFRTQFGHLNTWYSDAIFRFAFEGFDRLYSSLTLALTVG